MKLRIKGNSLRLRVSPSEMSRLLLNGRVEETIYFGAESDARLTYALMTHTSPAIDSMTVCHLPQEIAVQIPVAHAHAWADGEQIGIYAAIDTGAGKIEIAVEKDFSCLDKSEDENQDTYPNPNQGVIC